MQVRRYELKAASFALILSVLAGAMPAAAGPAKKDIVDTAVAARSFNTLATALQAAGLADTLKGKGPFTVFAPTDDAFSKLPAGTVESLLKPENKDKLRAILLYQWLRRCDGGPSDETVFSKNRQWPGPHNLGQQRRCHGQ